ncbi:hypothetical protein [Cellulomonas sp. HZM]|uniref:hypothetical protein n=1 Tax=Cellulomonas sp. HZM TaxID=1454010 RepID=UPI001E59F87F|nr:hypothetical protein [Cellulomonas sp. HZM]
MLDVDPELAYEHAQAAVRRGGRVDVVREAAGIAAYRTGRYAEALRELRTVRRLNGSSEHLPVMADCERGLGRPERAIVLSQEPEARTLDADGQVELAIVVSGARLDLGENEAAVATLATPAVRAARGVLAVRVAQARASALEAVGRDDEAVAELARFSQAELDAADGVVDEDDDIVVFDLDETDLDDDLGGLDESALDEGAAVADTIEDEDDLDVDGAAQQSDGDADRDEGAGGFSAGDPSDERRDGEETA